MVEGWQFNVALAGYETIFMNEDFEAAKPGDARRVYKFLDTRMQLGGTDLLKTFEAIAAKLPSEGNTHIVFVGDGINTIGKDEGAGLVKAIVAALQDFPSEVSCVSVGSSYDRLVLEGLANQKGGTFRAVEGVDNVFIAAESILEDFSRPVYRNVKVRFDGVEAGGLYPDNPGTVSEGETAIALGRITKGGKGKAIVTGIAEGQPFKKEYPIELKGNTEQNHFVPRLWATAHMDSLRARMNISGTKADAYLRNQVIATSLNYQIMSPFTAFLCLESEEDYKRFGIVRRNRMLDWKGELEGITNNAADVVARVKPKKPKPSLKHIRIPSPRLNFVPQEIFEEARALIQVEKQFQESAQSWGGSGGGGTFYSSAINSELSAISGRSEIGSRNARASNVLRLYDVRDLLSSIPDYSGTGFPSIGAGFLGGDLFRDAKSKEQNGRESRLDFLGENALSDLQKNVEGDGDYEVAYSGKRPQLPSTEMFKSIGFGDGLEMSSEMSSLDSLGDSELDDFDFGMFEDGKKGANKLLSDLSSFALDASESMPMRGMAEGLSYKRKSQRNNYAYRQQQLYPQSYLRRNSIREVKLANDKTLKVRWGAADEVYLQRSLLANPKDLQTRLDLTLSLASRRRLSEARRTLEPMLENAQSAALWLEFAWLDYHLGDRAQSKVSVQKAIPLAADLTTKQHCGYELSTLGAQTEASNYFLKLAEQEETTPNHTLNHFGNAYNYANSSAELRATAHEIWAKAIRKLPKYEQALARAASSLQSAQPELALKYIAQHESLVLRTRFDHTPSDLSNARMNCLFALGRRNEAWKALEHQARTATDHNMVYQAFSIAYQRDHMRTFKLMSEILDDEKTYPITGPQVHGVVRFHQSYNSTLVTRKRLLKLAERADLPANLRTSIFYATHRHGGRNREWAKVLLPLKKVDLKADLTAAISAAQALISYGYHTDAKTFMDEIAEAKLNETQNKQIQLMRWQTLSGAGEIEKAAEHLEETFSKVKDPQHAYSLLTYSIHHLISNNKGALAIKLHAEMFRRFPNHANNQYLHQNLFNQLRNRGQLGLLRKHQESQQPKEESELVKELGTEWDQVVALAREKEFGKAFDALEKFQGMLANTRAKLTKEMEAAESLVKQVQSKTVSGDENVEGRQKRLQELHESYGNMLGDYDVCIGLMELSFRLRIQIAANDKNLAKLFLLECNEKSKNEDPRTREWTQAKLLCLALSDERETYRETLGSLYKAEPQDPIWPRLLVNARFAGDDSEGGLELLDMVCKQDPFDSRFARTWYGIQKRIGTDEEITAARDQYFRALAIMPNVLQQLAYRWQNQKNIEFAVAAWMAMQQTPTYNNNGWPTYQAATVLQATDKERAIDLYFKIFKKQFYASTYGQNSLSQLRSLMNDEATRNLIENRLPELTEAKEIWTRNCGHILAAHIAQIRKKDLTPHLKNLFQVSEKDLQNVTSSLMDFFVHAKAFDQMYQYVIAQLNVLAQQQKQNIIQTATYRLISSGRRNQKVQDLIKKFIALARSDELSLSKHQRSNMLRNIASNLGSYKETRPIATQIYRELIEQHDSNSSNNLHQLVQWLINDNRVAEARQLLEKSRSYRADWNLWYAHDRVIQHVGNTKKNYALAAKIAYEAWKKWDGQLQNYGQNIFNRFTEMSWNAMRKGGLPADLKEALKKEILRLGEAHFQGRNANAYNQGHIWNCIEHLGLVDTFRKFATDALDSDDPQRVFNAAVFASYASNYKHKMFVEAERGFRKLLDMNAPHNQKQQTYNHLYSLYTNSHFKRWTDAIEILEPWKNAGNLKQETYLHNRAYCLYKLRRNKEGREVALELLKQPNYRRYYWNAQNIATWCREAKDYITEVECLEHGMRWMRYIGQLQPNYVTQFYTAMGNAYRNMGETEKSYEAFLRGMSLLNRNRNDWHYRNITENLIKAMKQDAKGSGPDDMVAYYEKNMLKGGEMPHMRIAFGDAYEKAGQNLKSLQQYSIAADLIPKDTSLRDKVINGFIKEGRQDLAEKEYLSWAKLDPQNIKIYKRLGELYEKMDLFRLAMSAFTSMPEARPREAEGHQEFAKILISKNKLKEAVAPYEKAVRYIPTLFSIADEYAKLQSQLGADGKRLHQIFTNGEEACRRAIEVLEDDPLPWLNLARFLKAQKRKAETQSLLKEILNKKWPRFARETRDEAMKIQQEL
jgi:hypothetical protein